MSLKKMKGKREAERDTAYLTIGRWQPPHRGHEVLIKKTLDLAKENNGNAYVYIHSYDPSQSFLDIKHKSYNDILSYARQRRKKNPLSSSDRLYYMQKMFPEYKTVYNPDEDAYYDVPEYHRNYFDFLMGTGENYNRTNDKRGFVIRQEKHGHISHEIIRYLKNKGKKKIILVVGSDRVNNFKKYNPDIEVIQAGEERGKSGEGKLSSSDIALVNISDDINLDTMLTDYQPAKPVKFSGTKMRHYVKSNNTRKFVEGCAIGNMTYRDCLDMMDDVREGMGLNLLSKWNKKKTKNQIKINPNEHSPGVITHMSQAHLDSQSKQDASGFIIQGGKRRKKIKKRKTKRKRTRKRRTRKRRTRKKRRR